MSKIERIYFFHQRVRNHTFPNTRTIIEKFEVSESTARRDIDYLRDFLLAPLEYDRRKNGWFYSKEGFRLPFEETHDVITFLGILQKMAKEAGLSQLPEVKRLEERLMQIMPDYSKSTLRAIRFEKIEASQVAGETLKALLEAIEANRPISFKYYTPRGENTQRKMAPLRLINYQWRWYVYGYCLLREALRMFHIPRMSGITLMNERIKADIPDEQDLEELLDASFGIFKGRPRAKAKIKFMEDAAFIVSEQIWHKDQRLKWLNDKELLLTLPVTRLDEIAMKVLQYGKRALVIEPPELKAYVKKEAKEIFQNYP